MKYISLAIIPFVVGLLMPMIFSLIKKSNIKKESKMNINDFIICYSIIWSWIMIIVSFVITLILVLLNIFEASNLAANIIVPIFIIIFLIGSYSCIREKIIVKNNTIKITPLFGKVKDYTFNNITKIKETRWSNGMISYSVYGEKKLFSIADTLPGFNLFIKKIQDKNIYIETIDDQIKKNKAE